MKAPCKKPCGECPFRRKSIPGWLGADNAAGFMATTMADHPMPCHSTVDYERADWNDDLFSAETEARYCAGALIFFANIGKLSRDRNRPRLPADPKNVFKTPAEFIAHHPDWKGRTE